MRQAESRAAHEGEGGAGDGIRTRDILLGKQTLCQLSYSRPGGRHCSGSTPWGGLRLTIREQQVLSPNPSVGSAGLNLEPGRSCRASASSLRSCPRSPSTIIHTSRTRTATHAPSAAGMGSTAAIRAAETPRRTGRENRSDGARPRIRAGTDRARGRDRAGAASRRRGLPGSPVLAAPDRRPRLADPGRSRARAGAARDRLDHRHGDGLGHRCGPRLGSSPAPRAVAAGARLGRNAGRGRGDTPHLRGHRAGRGRGGRRPGHRRAPARGRHPGGPRRPALGRGRRPSPAGDRRQHRGPRRRREDLARRERRRDRRKRREHGLGPPVRGVHDVLPPHERLGLVALAYPGPGRVASLGDGPGRRCGRRAPRGPPPVGRGTRHPRGADRPRPAARAGSTGGAAARHARIRGGLHPVRGTGRGHRRRSPGRAGVDRTGRHAGPVHRHRRGEVRRGPVRRPAPRGRQRPGQPGDRAGRPARRRLRCGLLRPGRRGPGRHRPAGRRRRARGRAPRGGRRRARRRGARARVARPARRLELAPPRRDRPRRRPPPRGPPGPAAGAPAHPGRRPRGDTRAPRREARGGAAGDARLRRPSSPRP